MSYSPNEKPINLEEIHQKQQARSTEPEGETITKVFLDLKIVDDRPPNFNKILSVFPGAANPGVIFAYGETIFFPQSLRGSLAPTLPPELIAHETIHCERQILQGVEDWWDLYLSDADFRYNEELLAHRAEYQHLAEHMPSRQMRRRSLKQTAKRLCSPLYGKMVTMERAKRDIKNG